MRLSHWQSATAGVGQADAAGLRRLRSDARALRTAVDRFIDRADERLGVAASAGPGTLVAPAMADRAWRPGLWQFPRAGAARAAVESGFALDGVVSVFHDCSRGAVLARQVRNRPGAGADQALVIETLDFGGSYLSFSLRLPEVMAEGTGQAHILGAGILSDSERPQDVTVMLNLRAGPNLARRTVTIAGGSGWAEFELLHMGLNGQKISEIWMDFFPSERWMNRIAIRDLIVSRRPRSDF